MRALIITILFSFYSTHGFSQKGWMAFNDSCFKQTKRFYDSCKQLTSNKPISTKQIGIDRTLIKLINEVYNDPTYSFKRLKIETAHLENRGLNQNNKSGKSMLEFNANAEGNLYVSIKAVLEGDVLTAKQIYLATKTHVLCDGDPMYVNSLDFLYLNSLTKEIDFPLALKPYQSNLDIGRSD